MSVLNVYVTPVHSVIPFGISPVMKISSDGFTYIPVNEDRFNPFVKIESKVESIEKSEFNL